MTRETINEYRKLNSEDQKEANTVVGAILLAGLITLGSKRPGDESGATAQNAMRMQAKLALPISTPPARPRSDPDFPFRTLNIFPTNDANQ
jgi:hypothetical protein